MIKTIRLESESVESLRVTLRSRGAPTGLPGFALTATNVSNPSAFTSGTWEDSWDSATGLIHAITPTIGSGGGLVVAADATYKLWVTWTAGAETVVKLICLLEVK